MARLLHHRLEAWIKDTSGKVTIDTAIDRKNMRMTLVANGISGRKVYRTAVMAFKDSGISGGGSAPDGIESLVNDWYEHAGMKAKVIRGAR